jgi:hypothetical protein
LHLLLEHGAFLKNENHFLAISWNANVILKDFFDFDPNPIFLFVTYLYSANQNLIKIINDLKVYKIKAICTKIEIKGEISMPFLIRIIALFLIIFQMKKLAGNV